MTHLDDGRLRALMDDELSDSDASAVQLHLGECDPCLTRLAELEERSALVARALAQLDTAEPPSGAQSALFERIESAATGARGGPSQKVVSVEQSGRVWSSRALSTPLARAAIVVLLLGGVATALPASPVRGWIASAWARAAELLSSQESALTPVSPTEEVLPTSGGSVVAQDGALSGVLLDIVGNEVSVVLREIAPGTSIVVRMVPEREAGVFAGDPASFRTAEGRIEVTGAAGIVFVNLPREATTASIEVNGGIYLRKVGEQTDVTGPIQLRTAEEIHLRVP